MKNPINIEGVTISTDERGIVYKIPSGMSGKKFKAFKWLNKDKINAFKVANL